MRGGEASIVSSSSWKASLKKSFLSNLGQYYFWNWIGTVWKGIVKDALLKHLLGGFTLRGNGFVCVPSYSEQAHSFLGSDRRKTTPLSSCLSGEAGERLESREERAESPSHSVWIPQDQGVRLPGVTFSQSLGIQWQAQVGSRLQGEMIICWWGQGSTDCWMGLVWRLSSR